MRIGGGTGILQFFLGSAAVLIATHYYGNPTFNPAMGASRPGEQQSRAEVRKCFQGKGRTLEVTSKSNSQMLPTNEHYEQD
jgi:hypothetical protein